MRDYIEIGTTPCRENCAQVGATSYNYTSAARLECSVFRDMIVEKFGEPPIGTNITIKHNSHEFGSYYSIAIYFDEGTEGEDYAFKVEGNTPERWEKKHIDRLLKNGYPKELLDRE